MLDDIRTDLLQKQSAAEVVLAILSLRDEVRPQVIILLYAWWEARNKATLVKVCVLQNRLSTVLLCWQWNPNPEKKWWLRGHGQLRLGPGRQEMY